MKLRIDRGAEGVVLPPETSGHGLTGLWRRTRWFAPAAVIIILLRLRFFFGPIAPDEGGQYAIARAWNHGYVLYRDIWLDRPQGLLLMFRSLIWFHIDNLFGLRLMATLLCLIGSAACGRIAARLAGNERAAWMGAFFVGLLLSVPRMSGIALNGELASCPIGAVALACLLRGVWKRSEPSMGWVFLGGLVGGCAFGVKQSAFDGFVVGSLVVLVLALRSDWARAKRVLAVPVLVAGFFVSYGLVLLHAAITGWDRWFFAVFGYRSTKLGLFAGAEWGRLTSSGRRVAPVLVVAAVLLVVFAVRSVMNRRVGALLVLAVWFGLGAAAFLIGGRFFVHYWLILLFPLGTALGVYLSEVPQQRLRNVLIGAAALIPVGLGVFGIANRVRETQPAPDIEWDISVARWVNEHAEPGDETYAQCMSPALYAWLDSYPPFPYLWTKHIEPIPERRAALARLFEGNDAPTFIAEFNSPEQCDPSGVLAEVLKARYQLAATVDGVPVYVRSDRSDRAAA